MNSRCGIEGCDGNYYGSGLCRNHFRRNKLYGDPLASRPFGVPRVPVEDRFWEKVDTSGDCWIWTASRRRDGYGQISVMRRPALAHRVAYELSVGPIPEGMEIDHVCRDRACVKPDHLRVVTHKQNNENHGGALRHSKSGVRGVTWINNRWRGEVKHHGVKYHVGVFDDLAEAKAAVVAKRIELFTHNDIDRKEAI